MDIFNIFKNKKLPLRVIHLNGTFYEMGYEYGKLQKNSILGFYLALERIFLNSTVLFSWEEFKKASFASFEYYPNKFKHILEGLSNSTGLSLEKIIILNSFLEIPENRCTCLLYNKNNTYNSSIIMARNFDFPEFYKLFNQFLNLVIMKPENSSISTAFVTYSGLITSASYFNNSGLALAVNDALLANKTTYVNNSIPLGIVYLDLSLNCATIESAEQYVNSINYSYPTILNLANNENAISFEIMPEKTHKQVLRPHAKIISTNHFCNKAWDKMIINLNTNSCNSYERSKNLKHLIENNTNIIDLLKLREIFDIKITNGGVTFLDKTILQFIFDTNTLSLSIKAPDYFNWVDINLSQLFQAS